MFVRMTELESDKKAMDQNIQYVNDQVVPTLQKSPATGFKGAYWLCDRDAGKLMVFTLWESEQAMRASEDAMKQAREQGGNGSDGTGPWDRRTYRNVDITLDLELSFAVGAVVTLAVAISRQRRKRTPA